MTERVTSDQYHMDPITEPTDPSPSSDIYRGPVATPDRAEPGDTQHPLAEAARETKQTAGHLAKRASETGFQQLDQRRGQAADAVDHIAQNIRKVSQDLEMQQPAIASVVDTAADQAERLAGYLRRTDARQMLDSVQGYARRRPLLFVGGAFLAGLAASRLMKSATGGQQGTVGG
jgi:hypothetical protein